MDDNSGLTLINNWLERTGVTVGSMVRVIADRGGWARLDARPKCVGQVFKVKEIVLDDSDPYLTLTSVGLPGTRSYGGCFPFWVLVPVKDDEEA